MSIKSTWSVGVLEYWSDGKKYNTPALQDSSTPLSNRLSNNLLLLNQLSFEFFRKPMIKVTAAILVKDRKVLIAKRKSTDKLPDKWEFPGGKIEPDETPQDCLAREMEEEFGITVSVGEFLGESVYHYDHGGPRLIS
jgi:hypothetical protein